MIESSKELTLANAATRRRRHPRGIGFYVRLGVAITAGAMAILPLLWTIRIASKPSASYVTDPSGLGGGFTIENFSAAWRIGSFGSAILNSLMICGVGALIATTIAVLAGFALAKLRVLGRRIVFGLVFFGMCVPFPALVLPLLLVVLDLNLIGSPWVLAVTYGALYSSWGTLFMYFYFRSLPDSLLESARIDGAGNVDLFRYVAVPLAVPAIAMVFVFNVAGQWSELILALLLLPDPSEYTVTVGAALLTSQYVTEGPVIAAGVLIAVGPLLLMFMISQRFFRVNVLSGAVKA